MKTSSLLLLVPFFKATCAAPAPKPNSTSATNTPEVPAKHLPYDHSSAPQFSDDQGSFYASAPPPPSPYEAPPYYVQDVGESPDGPNFYRNGFWKRDAQPYYQPSNWQWGHAGNGNWGYNSWKRNADAEADPEAEAQAYYQPSNWQWGHAGNGNWGYNSWKRSADAEADPEAEAQAYYQPSNWQWGHAGNGNWGYNSWKRNADAEADPEAEAQAYYQPSNWQWGHAGNGNWGYNSWKRSNQVRGEAQAVTK